MIEGQETEIKLLASPERLAALLTDPLLADPPPANPLPNGEERCEDLLTTYFDTPDRDLQAAGASLRLRESGASETKRREQTFKRPSAGGASVERHEWTVAVEGERPDPARFEPAARTALTRLLAGAESESLFSVISESPGDSTRLEITLEAVASTSVERRVRRVRHGQSLIELAFDSGAIMAGEHSERLSELELELVEGRLTDCLDLALALGPGPDLRWSVKAKGERCMALAMGRPLEAVHASRVAYTGGRDVAKGLQAIGWNCLHQLLSNLELVTDRRDNEALHQARVAIRRLRAGLKLFEDAIGAGDDAGDARDIGYLRDRLNDVAHALGPARDLHVLLEHLAGAALSGDNAARPDAAEVGAGERLVAELTARREAALVSAGTALASGPVQRLLLEFAIWLEGLGQAGNAADAGERNANEAGDLTAFAAKQLKRCRKKVCRKGQDVSHMSDQEIHKLRLAVKKLRYAVGFFAPLWDGASDRKDAAKYEKLLGHLQDQLGTLHDMAEAQNNGAHWFAGLDPARAAALSAELKLRLADSWPASRKLKRKAERSLRRVLDRPCWWNG